MRSFVHMQLSKLISIESLSTNWFENLVVNIIQIQFKYDKCVSIPNNLIVSFYITGLEEQTVLNP